MLFINTLIFASIIIIFIILTYYFIFAFPKRKPKLSQFKILTNGKIFKLYYRGRYIEHYDSFKEVIGRRQELYKSVLCDWIKFNTKKYVSKPTKVKWVSISNEKQLKKYLKRHPELLEEL